jgi:hypothetical protein
MTAGFGKYLFRMRDTTPAGINLRNSAFKTICPVLNLIPVSAK